MQHTNGKIYGMAGNGGTHKWGVVYSFDVGLGPFVSLVSTTGKVGITIEVLGQGFTGTTAVSFNGTAATFTVVSDTYLKKNSLGRNPQKKDRVRMPYKRFSPLTF